MSLVVDLKIFRLGERRKMVSCRFAGGIRAVRERCDYSKGMKMMMTEFMVVKSDCKQKDRVKE